MKFLRLYWREWSVCVVGVDCNILWLKCSQPLRWDQDGTHSIFPLAFSKVPFFCLVPSAGHPPFFCLASFYLAAPFFCLAPPLPLVFCQSPLFLPGILCRESPNPWRFASPPLFPSGIFNGPIKLGVYRSVFLVLNKLYQGYCNFCK